MKEIKSPEKFKRIIKVFDDLIKIIGINEFRRLEPIFTYYQYQKELLFYAETIEELKKECSVDKYYPTLTEAVNTEYEIIRSTIKKKPKLNRVDYQREYYLKNKEKIALRKKKRNKETYISHPRVYIYKTREEKNKTVNIWRTKNKDKVNFNRRKNYHNDPEVKRNMVESHEKYRKNNKEKINKRARNNYLKRKELKTNPITSKERFLKEMRESGVEIK